MASDLTGMFAQLNKAISANPFAGELGGQLIDLTSQGFGQAAAAGGGMLTNKLNEGKPVGQQIGAPDPMTFMTKGAQKMQLDDEMNSIDIKTADGLTKAADLYRRMGDTENAIKLANAAKMKREEQMKLMEEEGNKIQDEARRKRGMAIAHSRGDLEGAQAIQGGIISPEEYYKQQLQSDLTVRGAVAGRDPYEGAFTKDVMMGGMEVPVRFNKRGEAIAILGEGRQNFELKEIFNPAIGATQMAAVDKNNPNNVQFVGVGEKPAPKYEIREMNDKFHVFVTPPAINGEAQPPRRVAVTDSLTDAELQMKDAKQNVKTANMVQSIDTAIQMIDDYGQDLDGVGGLSGLLEYIPGTKAREFSTYIESIRANVGFDQLMSMRAEGGTLGQVSNMENILLSSTISKLDTWSTPENLKRNLQKIREQTIRINTLTQTKDPSTLLEPIKDSKGQPTGNLMYRADADTFVVLYPDGQMKLVER